jgi:hypothetical protein
MWLFMFLAFFVALNVSGGGLCLFLLLKPTRQLINAKDMSKSLSRGFYSLGASLKHSLVRANNRGILVFGP